MRHPKRSRSLERSTGATGARAGPRKPEGAGRLRARGVSPRGKKLKSPPTGTVNPRGRALRSCIGVVAKLLTDPFVFLGNETKIVHIVETDFASITQERHSENPTWDNELGMRKAETGTELLANKCDSTSCGPITARGSVHLKNARIKM